LSTIKPAASIMSITAAENLRINFEARR